MKRTGYRHATTQKRLDSIFDYIKAYHSEHQYMPSVKEMSQRFGMSTSVIRYFLIQLEEDGRISRERGIARAIIITEE